MKTKTTIAIAAAATVGMFSLTSCDVDVVEEGKMPTVDVDVDAEAGKLPKLDVDVAEVEAGLKEVEVEVPKVKMEKETIKVPVVGIEKADASKPESEE